MRKNKTKMGDRSNVVYCYMKAVNRAFLESQKNKTGVSMSRLVNNVLDDIRLGRKPSVKSKND